jgi:flavin prenyltransferase
MANSIFWKRVLIGVTGASGSVYAYKLALRLLQAKWNPELIITAAGEQVVRFEKMSALLKLGIPKHNNEDFFAPPASGTAQYDAMVIIPCSMGSLGKIAAGTGDSLLIRAADVFLKEKRPLLLVPRENPFNAIHLENMLKLVHSGASILPAMPHFYQHPQTMDDLVETVVDKVAAHIHPELQTSPPWNQK